MSSSWVCHLPVANVQADEKCKRVRKGRIYLTAVKCLHSTWRSCSGFCLLVYRFQSRTLLNSFGNPAGNLISFEVLFSPACRSQTVIYRACSALYNL